MPDHVELVGCGQLGPPLVPLFHGLALSWQAPHCGAEAAALSVVACGAIDLFTGVQRHRIREYASSQRRLLFVDYSRPGRWRWCSSSACGGQAHAAA